MGFKSPFDLAFSILRFSEFFTSMLRLFIASLFILCFFQASGQATEKQLRDSLVLVQNDKSKIDLLIKLARSVAVHSPDSAMQLAMNASLIAKRSENEKDLARV